MTEAAEEILSNINVGLLRSQAGIHCRQMMRDQHKLNKLCDGNAPNFPPCLLCQNIAICKQTALTCEAFRDYVGGRPYDFKEREPDQTWDESFDETSDPNDKRRKGWERGALARSEEKKRRAAYALELWGEGFELKHIAEAMGIKVESVRVYLRESGVQLRPNQVKADKPDRTTTLLRGWRRA